LIGFEGADASAQLAVLGQSYEAGANFEQSRGEIFG